MKYTELVENELYKVMLHDIDLFLEKISKNNPNFSTKATKPKLTKNEKYTNDCFKGLSEIMYKCQALDYHPAFINSFPKTKEWNKIFNRGEYIQYHIEGYVSTITGLFDRCLHLTNQIYNLGMDDRYVKYNNIVTNKHIQKESVKKILESLNKSISNIKMVRNNVEHKGRYTDPDLDRILQLELVSKYEKNIKKLTAIQAVLKLGYSHYKRNMKKIMKTNNDSIISLIHQFFLCLLDKYRLNLSIV